MGKSRFLAAASHDLRHPLQTITLLQGMLEKRRPRRGNAQARAEAHPHGEHYGGHAGQAARHQPARSGNCDPGDHRFSGQALARRAEDRADIPPGATDGLDWRVVPSLTVRSDPRYFSQPSCNSAVERGEIYQKWQDPARLPKARRSKVRIEVRDTRCRYSRIGLPGDLRRIPSARTTPCARTKQGNSRPGLAIVQRLADLLGHTIDVLGSRLGAGRSSPSRCRWAGGGGACPGAGTGRDAGERVVRRYNPGRRGRSGGTRLAGAAA